MFNKLGTWRNTEKNRRRTHGHVKSDSESEDEQWFLGFDGNGGDVFLRDVRAVVQDIANRHKNGEFGSGSKKNCWKIWKKGWKTCQRFKS